VKKEVFFENNAEKEFDDLPLEVQREFNALIHKLQRDGQLREPESKKLTKDLLELKVRIDGQWRAIYAYYEDDFIVILLCFNKKVQKTPKQYIQLANQRLKKL